MKTFVESDPATPLVSIHLSFEGGAVRDPFDKLGLSSFMADMLSRGTGDLSAAGLAGAFDALGASFWTNGCLEDVMASLQVIPQNLGPALALFQRALSAPSFDPTEIERRRRQQLDWIASHRDDDTYLAVRAFRRGIHIPGWHPYSRTVAGTTDGLAAITRDDLLAAWRETITRARVRVALSGAISPSDGEGVADNLCAVLPTGGTPLAPLADPTLRRGRHLHVVNKPDRSQVTFALGQLGARYQDADWPAMTLAGVIFGGGMFQSRLMRELRTARGWTYGAHATFRMGQARGEFAMTCAVAERDAPGALALQLSMFEALATEGVSEEELSFAKGYLAGSHVFSLDTAEKRAHIRMEEETHGLPEGTLSRYPERIAKVTVGEVNAAIRTRFDPQHMVIAAVATNERVGDKLGASVPGVSTVTVAPFDGG